MQEPLSDALYARKRKRCVSFSVTGTEMSDLLQPEQDSSIMHGGLTQVALPIMSGNLPICKIEYRMLHLKGFPK